MKRLLVGSLMAVMIGTAAFAGVHHYDGDRGDMIRNNKMMYSHSMHRDGKGRHCRMNPENEKMRIMMDEKKLEIRKELLNEKPDWNKIERLNTEIAVKRSQLKTEMMKEKFENQQDRMEKIKRNAPLPPQM